MDDLEALKAKARDWMNGDPDAETRQEVRRLLEEHETAPGSNDLADRFAQNLEFGTAGLRGVLGGGPNRMNRAVVRLATHGLAGTVLAEVDAPKTRGVVVGCDARLMSRELAEDTACVLAAHGIRVYLFTDVCPTPLVAYALTALGCAAGVVVTASHNPPEYNGYKAYWENGAQIIPPIDTLVAQAIAAAPAAKDVPILPLAEARRQGLVLDVPFAIEEQYLAAAGSLVRSKRARRDLRIVYTPMHGVGGRLVAKLLAEAQFSALHVVAEQAAPDGRFPTVAFPNPEEKGAMDLSFALARSVSADLVLANDPDADRLAVAVPKAREDGGVDYVQLTGNQVGVLLGHHVLSQDADPATAVLLASLVSSPMLGVIARAAGATYEETLTGFKWIANRAMALEATGEHRFLFGYEEALGYTVGGLVRDKDGVSAALVFTELASELAAEGRSVLDRLEELYRRYGLFVSTQVNLTRKGQAGAQEIRAMIDGLRQRPPSTIGALAVLAVSDLEAGTRAEGGAVKPLALPASNVLVFELEGGSRVIARPSGTEPKVKFYVDVCEPMAEGEPLSVARARAEASMKALADAFVAIAVPAT
ncbi:MAG: phospho-sugar mutase [Myxococcales bacterium]|nr:phospho-sugar mutase [Myxococcales bacterium]HQY61616.1 phospho-sugar mutase [Polyangiaceae bacterium]